MYIYEISIILEISSCLQYLLLDIVGSEKSLVYKKHHDIVEIVLCGSETRSKQTLWFAVGVAVFRSEEKQLPCPKMSFSFAQAMWQGHMKTLLAADPAVPVKPSGDCSLGQHHDCKPKGASELESSS